MLQAIKLEAQCHLDPPLPTWRGQIEYSPRLPIKVRFLIMHSLHCYYFLCISCYYVLSKITLQYHDAWTRREGAGVGGPCHLSAKQQTRQVVVLQVDSRGGGESVRAD